MKRVSILFCVALLCAGSVWAEEEATVEAPAAVEEASAVVEVDFGGLDLDGGGCQLPDLSGLSDEEIEALAKDSGFSVGGQVDAQAPMCPTNSSCPSVQNCGVGNPCSVADLGPCCTTGGGLGLCCVTGTIKVKTCPCVCTGNPCAIQCPQGTHRRWGCR